MLSMEKSSFILRAQISFSPHLLPHSAARTFLCSQFQFLLSQYPIFLSYLSVYTFFFLSTPFFVFSVSKQSTCCCLSGAVRKVISWPVYVCQQMEGIWPFNHSAILQYTRAQEDKSLYWVACELVEKVWHIHVLQLSFIRKSVFW